MKKIMVILVLLMSVKSYAATTFIGYGSYINYADDPVKSSGYSLTNYISSGNLVHNFEFGINYSKINLLEPTLVESKNEYVTSYTMWNFTEAYSNWGGWIKNMAFRVGFHYMSSKDDDFSDRGKIVFGDITYFIPYKFYLGTEGITSQYTTPDGDLRVFQITPHINFRAFFSIVYGSLYMGGKAYIIALNNPQYVNIRGYTHYSYEGWLTYHYGDFSTTLSLWSGDQIFAVKNGGFVVYNLAENFTSGSTLNINYKSPGGVIAGITGELNRYNSLEDYTGRNLSQIVITGYIGFTM